MVEQSDFCVRTEEQAKEYFPKYIDGVTEIVEKYTSDYTFKQTDVPEEIPLSYVSSYTLYTEYTFGENLYFRLAYLFWSWGETPQDNYSYFMLTFYQNQAENTSDLQESAEKYSAMLYEIGDYCGYKVSGNERTLLKMYKKALKKFNKSEPDSDGTSSGLVRKYQPLLSDKWEGDFVSVTYKENTEKYYLIMQMAFFLSDRNILSV
jgi:hypothetical protein